MTTKSKRLISILIFAILILSACNLPGTTQETQPPPDPGRIQTSAAQTIEVELTNAARDDGPTQTQPPEPPPDDATEPPPPTVTLPPTVTDTPTPTFTPTTDVPCDQAAYVSETIPDGTDFDPGDVFTKVWRLRNTGSCTWTSGYDIVFVSGSSLGAPASVAVTSGTVAPGQVVEVEVQMTAPMAEGTYRGNWKLRNASNVIFGITNSGNGTFWVEIEVLAPPEPVDFSIAFDNVHNCGAGPYATARIVNIGTEFLESAEITVRDLDDAVNLYGPLINNQAFVGTPTGCPPGNSDADPGETYYIAVYIGSPPPSGHDARFTLKLCTQNSLGGDCVTRSVDFEIP